MGAGLFGSVFAHEMKEKGKKCLVIDRRDHLAGNIYTEEINGVRVHRYGAHIFHTSDREVWDYVNRYCEFNQYINSPVARYREELYNLPFNMNTFHGLWGIRTPEEAARIIRQQTQEIREQLNGEPQNLEEQALLLAGRDVYEKLVKGYTEKQWGRDCRELPAFIIRRLPMRFTYDNNYFNDRYQGIPIGGYTQLAEKLLNGIEVRLSCDFQENVTGGGTLADDGPGSENGMELFRMGEDTFERVLYTGMIDEFYHYCFGELEYRSLRFETEVLPETDNYQGNAVVNYTEREVPYTRIIEHKHFEFGRDSRTGKEIPGTIITREYPAVWEKGMEPYYPVNNDKNNALYEKYRALAGQQKNVLFGGRLGMYKYYNMDAVIRAALDLAAEQN